MTREPWLDVGDDLKKAVLITGASSGIGLHLTKRISETGHLVYATARTKKDLTMLASIEGVTPVALDVQDRDQILNAVDLVTSHKTGLYGLINNAGIGGIGFLSTWTEKELQEIIDVNLIGPWRMTNAFLDLLFASRGRVINIGSRGGSITKKLFGPYSMTKFGLEAYTEALREELSPHGVHASIIQPGGVVSEIAEKARPGILERLERAKPPFKEEAQQLKEILQDASQPLPEASSPELVYQAVNHALFSRSPRQRYLVGTRREGNRVINAFFEKIVQANLQPQLNDSREVLIKILNTYLDKLDS